MRPLMIMLFQKYSTILLAIFIILFVTQAWTLVPFKRDSFEVRATVSQLDVKSTFKTPKSYLLGYSHERYSYGQKRAVIRYASLWRKFEVGQLFYDLKERLSLRYGHLDRSCKLVSGPNEVNLVRNLDVSSLKLDESADSDHVIGLARLLLFVEHHKDKLKMVGEPLEKRNTIALEYSYSFDDVQLNIYYSGIALTRNPDALPMQVIVSAQQQIYVVDYSQLGSSSSIKQEINNPDEVYIDQFAFPRECAEQVRSRREQPLVADGFGKFSFQAKVAYGGSTRSFQLKVAYYHNMDLLSKSYASKKVDSDLINSRTVVDFKFKRAYQVLEIAGADKELERKCYVFKTGQLSKERQTISETLTGANSFTYLGLAEVRGTCVRLFVALNNTIPLWMEQPVEYSGGGSKKVRDPLMGMDSGKDPLTTLVYVADDDRVVHMELIRPTHRVGVQLFHFKWDLDPSERASDMFSLRLACANTNGIKHSQVELLLGKSDEQQFEVAPERSRLELSLLNIIQGSMSIPATMVYDLEAKLVAKRDLFVSFRVASHTDNIESLTYLGKGEMKAGQKAELLMVTNTFQICFQLVTKQKERRLLFGYNNRNKKCALISSFSHIELKTSEEQSGELMEFYVAMHELTRVTMVGKDGINGRWLEDSGRETHRQKLIAARLALDIPGPAEPFTWYQIKRLQVRPLGEQEVGLPEMVEGFGLLEGNGNERFEGSKSLLSLAECRSGCLASDSCQSYSLCQRPQGFECILSPSGFQSDSVKRQLAAGAAKQDDRFLNVTLEDGRQVKLSKRTNCALYNKLYLSLFVRDGKSLQSLKPEHRLMATTKGEEDCAQVCVQLNLQVLAQEAHLSLELNPLLSSKMSLEHKKELENLFAQRRENSKRLCTGFLYLEPSKVDIEDEEKLAATFKMSPEDLKSVTGYCSLEVSQPLKDDAIKWPQASPGGAKFTYMRYRFNLAHFYTAQKGVHLLASKLSKEQEAAYGLARRHSSELTEAHYVSMRQSLDMSNNLQEMFVTDERNCASLCFLSEFERSRGPWPMCKSFDIVHNDRLDRKICYLNSINLEEAVKNEWTSLVVDKGEASAWIEWAHYEPSFLIAQNIESLSEAKQELEESDWLRSKHLYTINGFSLFILSWLAILAGLFLGVKGGRRLLLNQNEREPERASIAKFDFANQVDEHGAIVD